MDNYELGTGSKEGTGSNRPTESLGPGPKRRADSSLGTLVGSLANLIAKQPALKNVWVEVDVNDIKPRSNPAFLEISGWERDGAGRTYGTALIPRTHASRILRKFEQQAGWGLAPGMRVRMQVSTRLSRKSEVTFFVEDIEPTPFSSEIERRRRAIRERLMREGIFSKNRLLPAPEYGFVHVITGRDSAALSDFEHEADRISEQYTCLFGYDFVTVQGPAAAEEIRKAIENTLGTLRRSFKVLDAIAIIRGGGAAADLASLDDYRLAKTVCEAPLPILTGIGHQRDSCILDEVAYHSFGTPSKLINGIETSIISSRERQG